MPVVAGRLVHLPAKYWPEKRDIINGTRDES